MLSEIEKGQIKQWIEDLIGKELSYISRSKTVIIEGVDWDSGGRVIVARDEGSIAIRWERIESIIRKLKDGNPVHVDTVLRSSGNDRTIIETIIANLPPVGYMKPNQGRNKSRNKVLQWMNGEVHSLGVLLDVSDEHYAVSLFSNDSSTAILSEKIIGKFVFKLLEFLTNNQLESTLFQYLVERNKELKSFNIEFQDYRLTSIFKISDNTISDLELKRGDKLRFFIEPIKIGTDFYYLSNQWTDGTDSRLDIQTLMLIFNSLYNNYKIVRKNDTYILFENKDKQNLPTDTISLSKPFLLLAGISGTGKTRFVREQAKATGSLSETYSLTSVRPDWHEPSDILGYISRLGNDGAEYVTTEVLQFIAKAWRAIIDTELKLQVIDNRLMVSGDQDELNNVPPYWLCLDEMNLAPVEQYFADYLSVLENREWCWDEEQFTYCCDSLLKLETIAQLANTDKLRNDLGFMEINYDEIWQHFCDYGMGLPFNLIVAGTVNMDETTHGFSRKVIDRALSFDFGEFFPNDFEHFFTPIVQHKALSYPLYSQATVNKLPDIDSTGAASIGFLESVNSVLDNTPFQLAFRALNELLLAVISNDPTDESELQAVWDDFLMHKVLPRIEGDYEKLALLNKTDSTNTNNEQSLLKKLAEVVEQQLVAIWHETKNSTSARPDLYREKLLAQDDDTQNNDKVLRIACRSRAKLSWMQQRLERSGFTSFWP